MKELDKETSFKLSWINFRIAFTIMHKLSYSYETIIPKKDYFMIVYSIKNKPVFHAVQQLPLNRNLKRVTRENYFALRINLN